jgi:hypothetical protein
MKKKAKKAAKGGRKSSVKDLTAKKAAAVKGGMINLRAELDKH